MSKQWKFHLKFNLLLSIVASIPITTVMLWGRHLLTIPQLVVDSVQAIAISFLVGAFVPYHYLHQWVKKHLVLSDSQFRWLSTGYVCLVISATVTGYFKWLYFGGTDAFWSNFWYDYPLSWAIAVVMSLWSEPALVRFIQEKWQDDVEGVRIAE